MSKGFLRARRAALIATGEAKNIFCTRRAREPIYVTIKASLEGEGDGRFRKSDHTI
jgi:hypothetical protein